MLYTTRPPIDVALSIIHRSPAILLLFFSAVPTNYLARQHFRISPPFGIDEKYFSRRTDVTCIRIVVIRDEWKLREFDGKFKATSDLLRSNSVSFRSDESFICIVRDKRPMRNSDRDSHPFAIVQRIFHHSENRIFRFKNFTAVQKILRRKGSRTTERQKFHGTLRSRNRTVVRAREKNKREEDSVPRA